MAPERLLYRVVVGSPILGQDLITFMLTSSNQLKIRESRSFAIEGQCMGTACPNIECANQSILKLTGSSLKSKNGFEDLLFILNFERVGSKQIFEMGGDLGWISLEKTAEYPDDLEDSNQADEARCLLTQLPVHDPVDLARLFRIVLQ